jgi:hypothetical protein
MPRSIFVLCILSATMMGCGRNLPSADNDSQLDDAAPFDQALSLEDAGQVMADAEPRDIGSADRIDQPDQEVVACTKGCVPRCKLLTRCQLFADGPQACLEACPQFSPERRECIDTLLCSTADPPCETAKRCITDPPALPDLLATKVEVAVSRPDIVYSFEVCNVGRGVPEQGFVVELFWDTPKPSGKPDWMTTIPAGVPSGSCGPYQIKRTQVPDGVYRSWLRVDSSRVIAETNEDNNLIGPLTVRVEQATGTYVDLVPTRFDAQKDGTDILYQLTVCNQGNVDAWFFNIDITYNSALAPVGQADFTTTILGLAVGKCRKIEHRYANAPVGLYGSWLQVDRLNLVAEKNEQDNVLGPRIVNVMADGGCTTTCGFAAGCGVVGVTDVRRCLTWCNGFDKKQKDCASAARNRLSCSALDQCQLPALPPAPPPLTACLTICNHLVDDCKLLPSSQRLPCMGGCQNLSDSKKQCALKAKNDNQCLVMMMCMF